MEIIPSTIKEQLEKQFSGYVSLSGKSRELAESELINLSLMRLSINIDGKEETYPTITTSDVSAKNKLIKAIKIDKWKITKEGKSKYGIVLEKHLRSKKRFYLESNINGFWGCLITEDKDIDLPSSFQNQKYESSVLFSWIVPYWTDVTVYSLISNDSQLTLCIV